MTRPVVHYDGPVALSVPAGARVTIEYGERRDPLYAGYEYHLHRDPRIRALERRGVMRLVGRPRVNVPFGGVSSWIEDRRTGKDRRAPKWDDLAVGGRRAQRRKR